MSTWETILSTVAFGLGNGGPGGLIWTFVAAWLGFILVSVSMAEMASMAPTSGTTNSSSQDLKNTLTNYRWTIPLGLRIRAFSGAEITILLCWMAEYSGIPG